MKFFLAALAATWLSIAPLPARALDVAAVDWRAWRAGSAGRRPPQTAGHIGLGDVPDACQSDRFRGSPDRPAAGRSGPLPHAHLRPSGYCSRPRSTGGRQRSSRRRQVGQGSAGPHRLWSPSSERSIYRPTRSIFLRIHCCARRCGIPNRAERPRSSIGCAPSAANRRRRSRRWRAEGSSWRSTSRAIRSSARAALCASYRCLEVRTSGGFPWPIFARPSFPIATIPAAGFANPIPLAHRRDQTSFRFGGVLPSGLGGVPRRGPALGPELGSYPSARVIALEVAYNHWVPFRYAWALTLVAFLAGLVSMGAPWRGFYAAAIAAFALACVAMLVGFAMRLGISGRAR